MAISRHSFGKCCRRHYCHRKQNGNYTIAQSLTLPGIYGGIIIRGITLGLPVIPQYASIVHFNWSLVFDNTASFGELFQLFSTLFENALSRTFFTDLRFLVMTSAVRLDLRKSVPYR